MLTRADALFDFAAARYYITSRSMMDDDIDIFETYFEDIYTAAASPNIYALVGWPPMASTARCRVLDDFRQKR